MANEYIRKEWAGGVVRTTLNGSIAGGTTTIVLTDGSSFPAGTFPFVIVIDRGTATEEKVLVQSRTGNSLTVLQRGYDGASAQSHTSGAFVEHVLDAYTVDQANAIASKMTTAGDMLYKQTTGDNTAFARLGIGTAGQALVSTGSAPSWGQVGTAALADNSVTSSKIADGNVTANELAAAVAGDGLVGGGGTALSVNVDNSTLEINADALRVKNAGITAAKLAAVTAGQLLLADNTGAPRFIAPTGDVTISDAGVTAIAAGSIVNADFSTATGALGGAWTSYAPTLGGAGWSLGTSGQAALGAYLQVGKTVFVYARMIFGTTGATFGVGRPTVSLPATPILPNLISGVWNGNCNIGGSNYSLFVSPVGATVEFYAHRVVTTYVDIAGVTSGIPAAWTAGSQLWFQGVFEAA
jgi:hypothetical protein